MQVNVIKAQLGHAFAIKGQLLNVDTAGISLLSVPVLLSDIYLQAHCHWEVASTARVFRSPWLRISNCMTEEKSS